MDQLTCAKCNLPKPLSDYSRTSRTCKACLAAYHREWYERTRERRREVQRRYLATEAGKEAARRKVKRYRERHPDRIRAAHARNFEHWMARYVVNKAVACGKLPAAATLPCKDCGTPAAEYDHHLGYELKHWLSVEAVCSECHWRRSAHMNPREP